MGLTANVFRQVDRQLADGTAVMQDCTNGGWSSRFNTVTLVNIKGPSEPTASAPAVILVPHPSLSHVSIHAKSLEHHEAGRWTMMGGNYLCSSDSRFGDTVREMLIESLVKRGLSKTVAASVMGDYYPGAIAIHDRIEG
jgi:hypothetical protein